MKKIYNILILFISAILISFIYFSKTQKVSPYQQYADLIPGTYRIGFTNLDNQTQIDSLLIEGKIPDWLNGTLYRNGPAKFTSDSSWVADWFDGLAMIHAFKIENGKISYANKFLMTDDFKKVQKTGKMSYAGFVQDPCRSIFKNIASLFVKDEPKRPKLNNANINVAKYSDHLIALYETPLPVEFDPKTLETIGVMHYDDQYPQSNIHDTPHPHYDAQAKEHLGYFTSFGKTSSHNVFRIKDGSTKRELIGSFEVEKPSYMHSFGLTKNYAILTALPLVVNPLDLLLKQKAFIRNFKWKPELGTKFIVFDRINNKVIGSFKGEPFFAFHVVNAFEENHNIIIDIVTYSDASEIYRSDFYHILEPRIGRPPLYQSVYSGILKRFTIDMKHDLVTSRIIYSEEIELPRINYENYSTKDYQYVYSFAGFSHYAADKLLKINVKNGQSIDWQEIDTYPGEPVFIATPNAKEEDDGVVLSVVLDAKKGVSFLLILDAKTFKEIARAYVPHHIPFGIHGQFFNK